MKKLFLIGVFLLCAALLSFGDNWKAIYSSQPKPAQIDLVSSNIDKTVLKVSLGGYYMHEVQTPNGTEYIINLPEATQLLTGGAPDMSKLTTSMIIPDLAGMDVRIISSKYTDYTDMSIAPSKGNFTRDIDPSTVPYTYGAVYQEDAFFPGDLVTLRNPYIIRDYRGQTVIINPFQYNPVSKILRVYHDITLEIFKANDQGVNPLVRSRVLTSVVKEFDNIYQRHFINANNTRYDPVDEHGNMLIISYGNFIAPVQPFIDWKIKTGIPVEVVDVATIGGSSAIKTYIANYYNANGLTFVLLVGDAEQVPSSYASGDSDNDYSYIVGNDHYPDLFIGRFSAENTNHVDIQVTRTLEYEQNPDVNFDWFTRAIGIASSQGTGDDNEYDYEHIRNINTDLLNFTYTYAAELFDGSQGGNDAPGNPTPAMVTTEVNTGSTIINYCGHGSTNAWSTSGFSSSDVSNLVNEHMWPFIWSVACVNGNFVGQSCFAEAWLRAENNGEPTGAVATLMSTINQSWDPPMCGQDEMADILVESYSDNIKRSFGGLSMNGCMQMNDEYGSAGWEMTDTWNCFGDPSVMVRTAMPQVMTTSYLLQIFIGSTSFTVNANAEGGLACLTLDGEIISTAYIVNGTAILQFEEITEPCVVDLVITAFNFIPHINQISAMPGNTPYVLYHDHDIIDTAGNGNGFIDFGETVNFTIDMKNFGGVDANDVELSINIYDEYITMIDSTEYYGTIPAGQVVSIPGAFSFTAAFNSPDEHAFLIGITATDENDSVWFSTVEEATYAPIINIGHMIIDDAALGNNNGRLDPGETAVIKVKNYNSGHCPAENAMATIFTECHYLEFDNTSANLGTLGLLGHIYADYTVHVDPDAPDGVILAEFDYDLVSGAFMEEKTFIRKIGLLFEDWETGDFSKWDWNHNGNTDWEITHIYPYEGVYSAKSGTIDHGQSSELSLTLEIMTADSISFIRKVSSQANQDKLKFYMDNTLLGEWSGSMSWAKEIYYVPTGLHTFKWIYQKSSSGSAGSDCAWLDYIIMPPVMTLTCYAGPNDVACSEAVYQCEGEATDWVSVEWTSSGTGYFNNNFILDPVYTPSSEDISSGFVTLMLMATDDEGDTVDDEMLLSILEIPESPAMPQGPDYIDVWATPTAEYSVAPVADATYYTWQIEPAEAGIITGIGVECTVQWDNNYWGTANISVQAINQCGESDFSEGIEVTVDNTVGLAELPDNLNISIYPNPNNGEFFLALSASEEQHIDVSIVNTLGKQVYSQTGIHFTGKHSQNIYLDDLPNGIYFLIIKGKDLYLANKIIIR